MSYSISIGRNKAAAVEIHLDAPNPTSIPPKVGLGVGDKAARYRTHLDKCFNENSKLFNFLALIHKTGKEKGSITLICNCKLKSFHAASIKTFLETNKDLIDSVLPYIFRDAGYTAEQQIMNESKIPVQFETTKEEDGLEIPSMMTLDQLPPEDMIQIQKLIAEDQAKEESNAPLTY